MTSPSVGHPADLLDAAVRDVTERDQLWARRNSELAAVAAERQSVQDAWTRLVDETADVERLERLSPARIWAELHHNRAQRLDTERAEQQAAGYAVGVAEALGTAGAKLAARAATLAQRREDLLRSSEVSDFA